MGTTKVGYVTDGRRLVRDVALTRACHGHDVVITYLSRQAEAEKVVAEVEVLGPGEQVLIRKVPRG